jgi:hypothetical protein
MVCCLLNEKNIEDFRGTGKTYGKHLTITASPDTFVINKGAVYIRLSRFTPKGTFLRLPCQRQGASDQAGREHAIGKGESNFLVQSKNAISHK